MRFIRQVVLLYLIYGAHVVQGSSIGTVVVMSFTSGLRML
jgi:hypothetical protein